MRLIGMLEASKVWKGLCPTGAEISIPPLQAARKLIASGPAKPAPHSKQFNGLRLKLTQALCKQLAQVCKSLAPWLASHLRLAREDSQSHVE
jgi:hypothetical protein